MQPRPLFQRHLPDLDLISSWEHAVHETTPFRPQQHLPLENQHRAAPTTVGGMAMSAGPEEYSLTEYEAFQYLPSQAAVAQSVSAGNDSAWAQEMTRGQQEEDDEDDEDEFREEWSNDHFTQAYINSHQQQFRKIEEQEDLKEARLAEERERQRVVSGGPPRSAWMMAGSTVSAPNTSTASSIMPMDSGPKRLRVPGLQEPSSADVQDQISVDEFLQFHHAESLNGPSSIQPMLESQHQQQLKPIKAEDRFLSLVSDLRLAEQIYYPGASSATLIEQEPTSSEQPHSRITQLPSAGSGAWAQEFTDGHRYQQTRQQQRHLGAEWNWEKLFGKDPRKALQLATEASKASAAMAGGPASEMTEHERLKTVALARLQALFGHLSLASPHAAPCPP
ncbi:hypothetical protein BGZ72_006122 [Mortierella alpina]|nr:hypothetical protein BGZ72_006122 [Mortierella alpina]